MRFLDAGQPGKACRCPVPGLPGNDLCHDGEPAGPAADDLYLVSISRVDQFAQAADLPACKAMHAACRRQPERTDGETEDRHRDHKTGLFLSDGASRQARCRQQEGKFTELRQGQPLQRCTLPAFAHQPHDADIHRRLEQGHDQQQHQHGAEILGDKPQINQQADRQEKDHYQHALYRADGMNYLFALV